MYIFEWYVLTVAFIISRWCFHPRIDQSMKIFHSEQFMSTLANSISLPQCHLSVTTGFFALHGSGMCVHV